MNFVVVVPGPLADEITALDLPFEVEDRFYETLETQLAKHPEGKCRLLAAPILTLVHTCEVRDPFDPAIGHWFTTFLVFGIPGQLKAYQIDYTTTSEWDQIGPESEPDYEPPDD